MREQLTDRFSRFGALVRRRRYVVLIVWLVLAGGFGAMAGHAQKSLQGAGFDVNGSESQRVSEILDKQFHASPLTSAVVVYKSSGPVTDADFSAKASALDTRLRAVPGVTEVRSFFDVGDPSLLAKDQHLAIAVVSLAGGQNAAQNAIPALRDVTTGAGIDVKVTGFPGVQYDTFKLSKDDLAKTEMITFPVVMIFLLIFFRTIVAALVPLVLGGIAVASATGLIGILGDQFPISVFALNIGSLIGLGLSIDFSLIMVRRFREELATKEVPDAIARTMATAGRSVFYSGLTLLFSMAAVTIVFSDLMIVRSITLGVFIVAGLGLAGGLTLVPALLSVLGRRVDALPILPRPRPRPENTGPWYRLSTSVTRRPLAWMFLGLLVLGVLAIPLWHIKVVGANTGALPADMESRVGADEVDRAFGQNQITPIRLVVKTSTADGALTPEFLTALRHLTNQVSADPRTQQAASLSTLFASVPDAQYRQVTRDWFSPQPKAGPTGLPTVATPIARQFINLDGAADTATVLIVPKAGMYDSGHLSFVTDLRDRIIPGLSDLHGYQVLVGGDAASFVDFKGALYGRFPLVALVISVAILILLMLFFRSLLIPLKAAVSSAIPLVATYGVLVWLFQDGHGEKLFGFTSQGRLNVVTPLIVFVILFALSTDYEVFLLSRVRENYQRTGDTVRSVALGMQQTAGLIMAAAMILIATFGSLAASSVETLKEIGIGLAVGILLDATIVRLIIVPATMQLARGGNWWLPAWLERILPRIDHGEDAPSTSAVEPAASDIPDSVRQGSASSPTRT